MSVRILIYLFVSLVVIFAIDSVNINNIFKKNKIIQARIFYFLLAFSLIYIISNLIFDFIEIFKLL